MHKKMVSIFQSLFSRVLIVLIIMVMLINFVMPDQSISTSENRSLSQFPELSQVSLLNGKFNTNFSSWFSDQFVGRNLLVHLRYLVLKNTGQKEINGVYLTKKGLIEEISQPNETQMARNLAAINTFYSNNPVNTYFLVAPNSACVNSEYLPKYIEQNQDELINQIWSQLDENIVRVDAGSVLKEHVDEYIYYKTDHHWTTLGAFYGFSAFAQSAGLEANIDNYKIYTISNDFTGTLSGKTGSVGIKDTVEIYVGKEDPDYIFSNNSLGTKSRTLYSSEAGESSNPYEVFMGGNYSLVRLEMDNESDRRLLIFKDSYANSLIPFLIPYFRTISIVDPRYYYEDINKVLEHDYITDVLYCYNGNTFVEDTSLADVIE